MGSTNEKNGHKNYWVEKSEILKLVLQSFLLFSEMEK